MRKKQFLKVYMIHYLSVSEERWNVRVKVGQKLQSS